ncbi:MAG: hypothetical protein GEU90_10770 [Gemmatimonas sp.]|nr:hypothetical protein [Gemmatimonas sp.]
MRAATMGHEAGRRTAWLLGTLLLALPAAAAGQEATGIGGREDPQGFVGPLLDPGHWAVVAAERLRAAGFAEGYLPAQKATPLEQVERVLREAVPAASQRNPEVAGLASAWHARLLEEFGGLSAIGSTETPLVNPVGIRVGVGVATRRGVVAPGTGEFEPERSGALPLSDRTRPMLVGDIAASVGRSVGVSVGLAVDDERLDLERVELAAGWRGMRASIGRVPIAYAHGRGGGVLLSGNVPLDAIQLGTREAFRLPWILAAIGPVSLHTFLGRMFDDRHPGEPYIWGGSVLFEPHSRMTLGIHRAALFGGEGSAPITARRVLNMLIGRVSELGFEDQIVSVSGRFNLPTESVLPVTAYLEWGAEDAANAWIDVPGLVGGAWIPSLPFAPEAGLGVEYAHFATSCCGNPEWYRHWSFVGSWASGDVTLGHPVGGNGTELMIYGSGDFFDARLRIDATAFQRDRRAENLFVPGRTGESNGGTLTVGVRATPSWEIRLEGALEDGTEWTERQVRVEAIHH